MGDKKRKKRQGMRESIYRERREWKKYIQAVKKKQEKKMNAMKPEM